MTVVHMSHSRREYTRWCDHTYFIPWTQLCMDSESKIGAVKAELLGVTTQTVLGCMTSQPQCLCMPNALLDHLSQQPALHIRMSSIEMTVLKKHKAHRALPKGNRSSTDKCNKVGNRYTIPRWAIHTNNGHNSAPH